MRPREQPPAAAVQAGRTPARRTPSRGPAATRDAPWQGKGLARLSGSELSGGVTLFAWCLRKLPLALSPSPLSKSFHHHALPAPVGRTHSKPLARRLEGPRYCSASGLA